MAVFLIKAYAFFLALFLLRLFVSTMPFILNSYCQLIFIQIRGLQEQSTAYSAYIFLRVTTKSLYQPITIKGLKYPTQLKMHEFLRVYEYTTDLSDMIFNSRKLDFLCSCYFPSNF